MYVGIGKGKIFKHRKDLSKIYRKYIYVTLFKEENEIGMATFKNRFIIYSIKAENFHA